MGNVEDMRRELERIKAKEKAEKEVRENMRKRDAERRQLKSELRSRKYRKTTKVLRGSAKAGRVISNVLGGLGNAITQGAKQSTVREPVKRAPVRRVVRRRAPVRRKTSQVKKSVNNWWMEY